MNAPLAGPHGQHYEGTWIKPWQAELTMFLQHVFEELEAGHADHLLPDPFHQRAGGRSPLTDADCDRLVTALDAEYDYEIRTSANHHKNRSGATERTGLDRLPPLARRYLAEGADRILERNETVDQRPPPVVLEPSYTGGHG